MRTACRLSLLSLLGAIGCFQDSTPQHSDFLPLDYKSSFHEVRTCRIVTGHDLAFQRVLANPLASDQYTASSFPLPAGSVIVGEQHTDPSCNSLTGFYLMTKEQPGYDRAGGDWRWQRLDANQRVREDGRLATCTSCHVLPPCNDYLCAPP